MHLWLPPGAIIVVLIALTFVWLAFGLAGRGHYRFASVLIATAALSVRSYAAADKVLHPWDERYHALVAKHLIANPLLPTLYLNPLLGFDYTKWTSNHVWLHKPPLSLWAMAASMKVFGTNEVALRVPSLLASAAAVVVTAYIGKALLTPTIGLIAAVFQSSNGFLVELSAGRRASDHVDTLLILIVELGILAGLTLHRRGAYRSAVVVGVAAGLAYLTKSMAGLILLAIWGLMRLQTAPLRVAVRDLVIAGGVAIVVAAPWSVYTARSFPLEATFERNYALRHTVEVIEGQGGPVWAYVAEMPRFFGELIFIPLVWALYTWARGTAAASRRMLISWIALPYVLYSSFATKMPEYVMVAAPAIFLIEAEFWVQLRDYWGATSGTRRRGATILLIVMAILPARQMLEPTGPLERRDRIPEWTRDLRSLNDQIGPHDAVVFNLRHPVEAMFYTPYTAYEFFPTETQIRDLQNRGFRVYVYDDGAAVIEEGLKRQATILHPLR
jgi:4-amino-4-deoxy-L-arabinose transferase-like glycosyltransferase